MRRRPLTSALIAFEGVEGAGKSTQLDLLRRELERRGREVVVTREPGGTPVGERVRAVLLDPAADLCPRTEALLFAAARAQLVEQVIRPALQRGAVVLCDRYLDSSLAYQGGGRRLGVNEVRTLNRFATGGLEPDRTLLLRIDPAQGLARIARRREDVDRLEREKTAFFLAVATAYDELAATEPQRVAVIDAAQDPEAVLADALDALSTWL
jgi:dTMP kinase